VYFVDVFVRRMSLLERILPFTRPDGSTVVPEQQLLPAGTSEKERDQQNAEDMERSEQIASAVPLALGTTSGGSAGSSSRSPRWAAAGEIESGDGSSRWTASRSDPGRAAARSWRR
jgi:hypothetical protein